MHKGVRVEFHKSLHDAVEGARRFPVVGLRAFFL